MMKLVSQKFSTLMTPMPIINSEKAALWPNLILSMGRFCDIQNNRNSILVISPNQALVSNCRVSSDNSISFYGTLCRLLIGNNYPRPWLQSELNSFGFFFSRCLMDHLIYIQRCKLQDPLLDPSCSIGLDLGCNLLLISFKKYTNIQITLANKLDNTLSNSFIIFAEKIFQRFLSLFACIVLKFLRKFTKKAVGRESLSR